jgi:hypothetical protein
MRSVRTCVNSLRAYGTLATSELTPECPDNSRLRKVADFGVGVQCSLDDSGSVCDPGSSDGQLKRWRRKLNQEEVVRK